jgi:hypothetical protein
MPYTRADKLRISVAYALFKLKVPDRKGRLLSEAERFAVADRVVAALRLYGDQWRLDEIVEAPALRLGADYPGGPPKP